MYVARADRCYECERAPLGICSPCWEQIQALNAEIVRQAARSIQERIAHAGLLVRAAVCCWPGCIRDAEWHLDPDDPSRHPADRYTLACTEHVGALLDDTEHTTVSRYRDA